MYRPWSPVSNSMVFSIQTSFLTFWYFVGYGVKIPSESREVGTTAEPCNLVSGALE